MRKLLNTATHKKRVRVTRAKFLPMFFTFFPLMRQELQKCANKGNEDEEKKDENNAGFKLRPCKC